VIAWVYVIDIQDGILQEEKQQAARSAGKKQANKPASCKLEKDQVGPASSRLHKPDVKMYTRAVRLFYPYTRQYELKLFI
jgi:hypothetical protein